MSRTFHIRTRPGLPLLPGGLLRAQDRPDKPRNLRVTVGNGVATARWDPVEGATMYLLNLKAAVGPDGSRVQRQLWAPEPGLPGTSIVIPHDILVQGVPVKLHLTAFWSGPDIASPPATLEFIPPDGLAAPCSPGGTDRRSRDSRRRGGAQDGIPMGAMGWIFRKDDALTVYEAVSPAEGALALRLTQSELLDALSFPRTEAAAVKISEDRRVAVSLRPDRKLVISMGPNPEGKVLHTVLMGGLFGPLISTYTTHSTQPPGEGWQVLPPLA